MHPVHLDSAEILHAIYRDKSDLFDVYCKSSNTKVYILQLVYGIWDLILSVSDHCLSFYFVHVCHVLLT